MQTNDTTRSVAAIRSALCDIAGNLSSPEPMIADDPKLVAVLDDVLAGLRAAVLDGEARVEVQDWARGFVRDSDGLWQPFRTP